MPEFYSVAAGIAGSGLDDFTKAYILAIYFTETGDTEQPDSEVLMSEEARREVIADCTAFQLRACVEIADAFVAFPEYNMERAGHDFWLTRNGHGAGFWDRGMGEIGDRLTAIAKEFGETSAYQGDDGMLYLD